MARPAAGSEGDRRAEFRALVLEIDRRAVALDVQRWRRAVPGSNLSVIEHLLELHERWRGDPPPSRGGTARAVRPATLLRAWRREGRAFPDRLAASCAAPDRLERRYLDELAAVRRCLAAFRAVTPSDAGPTPPGRNP